jgi:hypothetical protein
MSNFNSIEKIWSGEKQEKIIFNENLGIGELILDALKLTPDRITQVSADNGSEMIERTMKIANHLMKN